MFDTGNSASWLPTAICVVEFASSTLRCKPLTVVTTASSENVAWASDTSMTNGVPAATVTLTFFGEYPMRVNSSTAAPFAMARNV